MKSPRPDIVYPVRSGTYNEELRFSLRSLSNLPHDRVIIVGGLPHFVNRKRVTFLSRDQNGELKWHATTKHLLYAVESIPDLSDPFLLFNDDFYVMKPIRGGMPVYHRGDLGNLIDWYRKHVHQGSYFRGMTETYSLLKAIGIPKPLAYNLHVPLPVYHGPLAHAYRQGKGIEALHLRTLYGNIAGLGGTYMEDVKIYPSTRTGWETLTFLSSNDDLPYGAITRVLTEAFPKVSRYESD